MKTIVRVTLDHDQDVECPCDNEGSWQLYSFNRRHSRFLYPDKIEEKFPDLPRLQLCGLAFTLGYFEHGNCQWALSGEQWQDTWDSVNVAGVLVWEEDPTNMGARTVEDRREDARAFCREYTAWCNGECYYYAIDKFVVPDDFEGDLDDIEAAERLGLEMPFQHDHVDSRGGFIGYEYFIEAVREVVADAEFSDAEFEIAGNCKSFVSVSDLTGKKKGAA